MMLRKSPNATEPHPDIEARCEALARPDKWYLSAADGILWAPSFPQWLDYPGFWDQATIYEHPIAPIFTVAIVGPTGRAAPLRCLERSWRPDRLTTRFQLPSGLQLIETKTAAAAGIFSSTFTLAEPADLDQARAQLAEARFVAWTAQPSPHCALADAPAAAIAWTRTLSDRHENQLPVRMTLVSSDASAPAAALRTEGSANHPHWRFTPFLERWTPDQGLRPERRLEGIHERGLDYFALAAAPNLNAHDPIATFTIQLLPDDPDHQLPGAAAAIPSPAQPAPPSPIPGHLATFPTLTCDDPHLERYFDYRIFGLLLCRLEGGAGHVRHPAIAEGISYFHVPITYSAQCHMLEMRWCHDPAVARGSLLNFIEQQKTEPDPNHGGFHGRIYTNHLINTDFYHANWGEAALAIDALHPDDGFLERIAEPLERYANWLDRERDKGGTGMIDVINHFETGQEYMSRYQAVNPKADLEGWKDSTHLKAIDATVYAYQLKRALATIARRLDRPDHAEAWDQRADHVARAINESMWDPKVGMFSDVDPKADRRTGVKAAVCFYPMITDLLDDDQQLSRLDAMLEHLTNPEEFWTTWPVPSSAVDDPLFNPDAEWKGKRHVCPWNGRVWPMTNAHIIHGLIRQYRRRSPEASSDDARTRSGAIAAELLEKFVKLMFHDRDLRRPNCFEHYNPFTGHACEYRGIDDYQHSWVIDLLIRGLCGLDIETDERNHPVAIVIDPLPMNVRTFSLTAIPLRSRLVDLRKDADTVTLDIDGTHHQTTIGNPLRIELS